jgi:hypothetical protein
MPILNPLTVPRGDARYLKKNTDIDMGDHKIINLNLLPTTPGEAASKQYVDDVASAGGGDVGRLLINSTGHVLHDTTGVLVTKIG